DHGVVALGGSGFLCEGRRGAVRGGQQDRARGIVAYEHERRRPFLHASRDVRDVPPCRGDAPIAGGVRAEAGSRRPGGRCPWIGHGALGHVDDRARHRGDPLMPRTEPPTSETTQPFWDATRDQQLVVQWCCECDRPIAYPREVCPFCAATVLEWRPSEGRG